MVIVSSDFCMGLRGGKEAHVGSSSYMECSVSQSLSLLRQFVPSIVSIAGARTRACVFSED